MSFDATSTLALSINVQSEIQSKLELLHLLFLLSETDLECFGTFSATHKLSMSFHVHSFSSHLH